jgi:hypothetical protein
VSLAKNSAHIAAQIFSKYNTKQNMIYNIESDQLFNMYVDQYADFLRSKGYSETNVIRFTNTYYHELLENTRTRIMSLAQTLDGGFFVNRKKTRSASSASKGRKTRKAKKTRKARRNN